MAIMTEEEADALDEELTGTTPRVNPDVRGVTAISNGARKGFKMMMVDDFSAEYITSKALATRQSPEEVIHAMIGNEMAVSV